MASKKRSKKSTSDTVNNSPGTQKPVHRKRAWPAGGPGPGPAALSGEHDSWLNCDLFGIRAEQESNIPLIEIGGEGSIAKVKPEGSKKRR